MYTLVFLQLWLFRVQFCQLYVYWVVVRNLMECLYIKLFFFKFVISYKKKITSCPRVLLQKNYDNLKALFLLLLVLYFTESS